MEEYASNPVGSGGSDPEQKRAWAIASAVIVALFALGLVILVQWRSSAPQPPPATPATPAAAARAQLLLPAKTAVS